MERLLKFFILVASHLHFLTATGTQEVSKWLEGEPSQRSGLDGFQDLQKQLNPGAPREPSLLPLFPIAPDPPPEIRESPQPTLIAPTVQTPIIVGASTANGKEGGSSMQAATVGPTRYHPPTRTGAAATGGDAAQPIHFVQSGRDTRKVACQQPASKRYRLDLNPELPQFPASGQGTTRLPGSAPSQFLPWYLTDGNNKPVSYQLGAASLADPAPPAPLPFYSYNRNMPQFYPMETEALPRLENPPPPPFSSSGGNRPRPFQLATQALPASAHPEESSRERALKAAAPQVGPPPKYGSASGVGNVNVISTDTSSSGIDGTVKISRDSKTRPTLLDDRHAVENNAATSNLRKSIQQVTSDSLACFPSTAWAWVTIIWIRNKDNAISETDEHFRQSFPQSISACLSRHNSQHEASSSGSAALGTSEPIKFVYLLWAINMRALELLKGEQQVPTYLDEQKDFMKWFTDFMTNCKNLGHCSDPKGDFLHEKIMTALDSKDDDARFLIILREIHRPHYTVTNKQALMNEAAVRAVTRYHKEKNARLFKFYQDIGFVRKLSEFSNMWSKRYVPRPGRALHFPYQRFQKAQVENHVKPINLSPGEPMEPLVLEDPEPRVWTWLSGLKSRIEQLVEEITTPNNILQVYIKQITREAQKKATYEPAEWEKRLYGLMWNINGSVLEAMGFPGSDADFLQQQAKTRAFFDQSLSKKESKRLEAEALGKNTKMDKFDELMKKWVFTKSKQPVFKIKQGYGSNPGYSFSSNQDIILAEIVVNIIGSYYKTQNMEKWITLFGKDANFVKFLVKLRLKQTNTLGLDRTQTRFNSPIEQLELFPWEKKTKLLDGELPENAQRLFQRPCRLLLASWIEYVQHKSTRN
ncbi:hypothetical protein VP01_597g7 [Puccinia sorghi]|uniref:Uncharacterized protein n=1 Tax=Puccinia sorghi TaxID=27349 RepID=A0A0L6UHL5_9BASI|nr:hypothetical protein VP01_597g7 [Puccinia sorghi]